MPTTGYQTFSADVSRDGKTPIGIVGVSGDRPSSLVLLSFNLSGSTAWAQVKASMSQVTASMRFYVLYV